MCEPVMKKRPVLAAAAFADLSFKLDILWVVLAGAVIQAFAFQEYFQKEMNCVDC
jgi:hypothetical protein